MPSSFFISDQLETSPPFVTFVLDTMTSWTISAPFPNVSPILSYGSPDGRLDADIIISPLIINDVGMADLPQGARLDMEIAEADFQHFVLPYLFSNY
jgi:hypothetical protein